MLTPGILWADHHKEVGKVMTSALLDLGLLDKQTCRHRARNLPRLSVILCTEPVTTWA